MLWRALGHIANGVYVDVGAQHPRIDSVSRVFYERGWRGIHIEPVSAFVDMLRQDRPDETVLQVAIGASEGTLELNVFADTGLSTAVELYAARHQEERGYEVQRITVPVLTLNAALRALEGKDVHWLKIDVEGFEEQVLRGWKSDRLRPWVLVIEATIPNSPEMDYESWDPIVTAAGYRFVYFDGLNRFYIANEHEELAAAFAVPPNIFDAVEVSGLASWGLYNHAVAAAQAQLAEAAARHEQAEAAHAAERREQQEALLAASHVHEEAMAAIRDEHQAAMAAVRHEHEAAIAAVRQEHEAAAAAAAARIAALEEQNQALSGALAGRVEQCAALDQRIAHMESANAHLETAQAEIQDVLQKREQQYTTACIEREAARAKAAQFWYLSERQREELSLVYGSRSWRVSAPLREAGLGARQARSFAARAARWALRQSAFLRGAIGNPGARGAPPPAAPGPDVVVVTRPGGQPVLRRLSPGATKVYADLKKAVEEGVN